MPFSIFAMLICSELTKLHDKEANTRGSTRCFYGWHVFSAALIRSFSWNVESDPTRENPWHAIVILPTAIDKGSDEFIQACQKISTDSMWRQRSTEVGIYSGGE